MQNSRPSSQFVSWLISQRDKANLNDMHFAAKLGITRGSWSSLVSGITDPIPTRNNEVGLKLLGAAANLYGWGAAPAIMNFLIGNAKLAKHRNRNQTHSDIAA